MEYLQSARPEKEMKKNAVFVRKRLFIVDLFEGLWSKGHVLAAKKENNFGHVLHPLLRFMGGENDTKHDSRPTTITLHAAFAANPISSVSIVPACAWYVILKIWYIRVRGMELLT